MRPISRLFMVWSSFSTVLVIAESAARNSGKIWCVSWMASWPFSRASIRAFVWPLSSATLMMWITKVVPRPRTPTTAAITPVTIITGLRVVRALCRYALLG